MNTRHKNRVSNKYFIEQKSFYFSRFYGEKTKTKYRASYFWL